MGIQKNFHKILFVQPTEVTPPGWNKCSTSSKALLIRMRHGLIPWHNSHLIDQLFNPSEEATAQSQIQTQSYSTFISFELMSPLHHHQIESTLDTWIQKTNYSIYNHCLHINTIRRDAFLLIVTNQLTEHQDLISKQRINLFQVFDWLSSSDIKSISCARLLTID